VEYEESYQQRQRDSLAKREVRMNSTFQFVLVLVVVLGILLLTYTEKLRKQDATTLIGMIVGYLLGKGKG
jgi:xanthine/uracil permease